MTPANLCKKNQCKILWVDDDPGILTTAERFFHFRDEQLITTSSVVEAREHLDKGEIAVIVADQRMPECSGIQLLNYALKESFHTTRILLTGFLESAVIEESVNKAQVFRFLLKPWNEKELTESIESAILYCHEKKNGSQVLKDASLKNKQLETLTGDLESIVLQRTNAIEESKNQVEVNLSQMRKLVLFVKELSRLRELDELLFLIKKEIRKFHRVGDPIIFYSTHDGRMRGMHLVHGEAVEFNVTEKWIENDEIGVNESEERRFVSRQLSRPVTKLLSIPLKRKSLGSFSPSCVLYIENDMQDDAMSEFMQFMKKRLQPMSVTVDRILLEYQAMFVAYQWESTFDGIAHPVAIIDSEWNLLRANKEFYSEIQKETKQIVQKAFIDKAIKSRQSQSTDIHVEGKIFTVYSYPIYQANSKKVTHVINYYFDITESRKLYGRVVQNEKLGAIGLLAGNIAHELNNPLTGVRSLSQVIKAELDKDKWQQVFDDISEVELAAERCQQIIKNLLEFSDSETNEELVEVSLKDVIEKTLPLVKTAMRQHSYHLEIDLDVSVRVKVSLLQQVIFNLVNNACQAMEDAGNLTLRTRLDECDESKTIFFDIEDTGPGIEEDILEHIFEPFFTTKDDGKGTGLGLSMSRSIVERFGGQLLVRSDVGKGTCFSIQLPQIGNGV